MVARKPVPQNARLDAAVPSEARTPDSNAQQQSLWSPANAEGERIWGGDQSGGQPRRNDSPARLRPGAASSYTSFEEEDNVWADRGATFDGLDRVPTVLRPDNSHRMESDLLSGLGTGSADFTPVPAVLIPAGGAIKAETNPFKRKMQDAPGTCSQDGFAKPAVSSNPPTLLPPVPFVSAFSGLNMNDSSRNPWEPALSDDKDSALAPPPPGPVLAEQDSGRENIWNSAKPSRQPTPGPGSKSPTLMSLPSEEGSAEWEKEKSTDAPKPFTAEEDEVLVDAHAWDDLGGAVGKGKAPAKASVTSDKSAAVTGDDWNLIDMDPRPGPPSRKSTWENFGDEDDNAPKPTAPVPESRAQEKAPELPPRTSTELLPQLPLRQVDKNETYQIKKVNWHDATAGKNPRTSPILVQNANGPCPLVALVNALSLTTPAGKTSTALVGALMSREQISIGLLLDAVFDELTSDRRMHPGVALPDLTELYNFLQGLHTGMNVNPRYVPASGVLKAFKRTSLTHLHPTERNDMMIPGTFEHTKEMTLYSTFSIPLIHGWLPSHDDPVYEAFVRQAPSYEDAQNLFFREEELEEKLSSSHHEGLTEDEQQLYQDILTIKSFLSISATQLTKFGLDVIRKTMKPGSVAILFRNDHFSTLYRHPQTLELLTLVTDEGYAGHAEVVWESLVDLTGERAEFFSGDFRLVGGASHELPARPKTQGSVTWADVASTNNGEWATVQDRAGRSQQRNQSHGPVEHLLPSPTNEQEDRDLALALQLQEEEDERHRREQDRRRKERCLSEQYIEQQARGPTSSTRNGNSRGDGSNHGASRSTTSLGSAHSGGTATARRNQASANGASNVRVTSSFAASTPGSTNNRPRAATQTVRSLIPPARQPVNRNPEDGLEEAPPSYEQAAKDPAYEPPTGHPSHPASSPTGTTPSLAPSTSESSQRPTTAPTPQQQGIVRPNRTSGPWASSGSQGNAGYPGTTGRVTGLRQGMPVVPPPRVLQSGNGNERRKDKECVVM